MRGRVEGQRRETKRRRDVERGSGRPAWAASRRGRRRESAVGWSVYGSRQKREEKKQGTGTPVDIG